jgi:hypothetical protein
MTVCGLEAGGMRVHFNEVVRKASRVATHSNYTVVQQLCHRPNVHLFTSYVYATIIAMVVRCREHQSKLVPGYGQ